jgi:hypothetical protein
MVLVVQGWSPASSRPDCSPASRYWPRNRVPALWLVFLADASVFFLKKMLLDWVRLRRVVVVDNGEETDGKV